ncbi:MAG: hypothetical protein JW744_01690 [Candidatus Diapherotrites archaeon]|uniref:Prefoldin subunit alpha n=1 Tax=Candidatus Iainarchaeum sp. TaxID=3101447 RepID=A0A939C9Y5_9ARCH|nr:hypothetical protein [Candidatus Diapherotrites archaeon]
MAQKKEIRLNQQQMLEAYRNEQSKLAFLQGRQAEMQQALMEIASAIDSISELGKAKKDEAILVSLGAGTYIEAKLSEMKKVKSGLAGNVLIEEDNEKVQKKLEMEREKVEASLAQLQKEMQTIANNLRGFESIFRQAREKMAGQSQGDVRSVS